MGKQKLRRLGTRTFKYNKKLGKVVEITVAEARAIDDSQRKAVTNFFKADWYEHIADKPLYIESKKQLREECDKRGMIAKALD